MQRVEPRGEVSEHKMTIKHTVSFSEREKKKEMKILNDRHCERPKQ